MKSRQIFKGSLILFLLSLVSLERPNIITSGAIRGLNRGGAKLACRGSTGQHKGVISQL